MKTGSFTLTGKHVLAIFVGFFSVVIIANAIFITLAVKSFPGEQEKKSYLQGVHYNERIAERDAQNALGWTAELAVIKSEDDNHSIDLNFRSPAGTPLSGLSVNGSVARPASDESDMAISFEEISAGLYRAEAPVSSGVWRLQATARRESGDQFELEKRLTIK